MTLSETIVQLTCTDFEITFKCSGQHLVLQLNKNGVMKQSWLPISDHCYEEKIVEHLNLIATEFDSSKALQ